MLRHNKCGISVCVAALLQHGCITKQTPTHDVKVANVNCRCTISPESHDAHIIDSQSPITDSENHPLADTSLFLTVSYSGHLIKVSYLSR